jgi:GNAT superfamily N-acetyltransferase
MTSETPLHPEDVRRLADLQAEILPSSLVSRLGRAYVRAFYRYVIRSREELLLTERGEDGRIAASCVVTLNVRSLERRLMLSTPLVPSALIRLPWLLDALLGGGQPVIAPGPELILLFTDPNERRRGYAGQLVARAESALKQLGYDVYLVRTFDDQSDPAFRFYKARGFETIGSFRTRGHGFALMRRSLS